MHTFLSMFTHLADFVFPRACSGCGESGAFLCDKCLTAIPNAVQPEYSFITAIFDYQNPIVRRAIWQFKYKNMRAIAKFFGERLYEEIISEIGESLHLSICKQKSEEFLLLPIPLHQKRLRERGYNQSELLAHAIMKHDTEKIFQLAPKALLRTLATKPQAKSEERAMRFKNLRGAFVASPALVRGKHIILIDDVTTTGATLSEARKTLIRAGARSVRAYAVAH